MQSPTNVEPQRSAWACNQERHSETDGGTEEAQRWKPGSGVKALSLLKVEQRRVPLQGSQSGGAAKKHEKKAMRLDVKTEN